MKRFNCDFGSRFRILKGGKISLVVSAILSSATLVFASPTGGTVTSGTANISQSGNTTNITQSTNKATINWQDFSIKSNETVNFKQPNVNSITLNRVVGNERSIIDGALNANGQVWILNSNGILFNNTAKINTAGILATTKNISDADFNVDNYKFTGNSTAGVINMGTIEASDSGYVALLANTVQNNGTIKAYKGTVHLTGASEATINLNGNSIVSLTVNKGVLDALVENKGAVLADGGKIFLTTNAVDEILKGVVNNTGLIEANSLDDISGEVILFAHGGTANISGEIKADGGFVETSGEIVNILKNAHVSTKSTDGTVGTWLIDPKDFIVASTGGHMTGAQVNMALGSNNFIIQTTTMGTDGGNGDIFINDDISWSANTLTLLAERHINVNKVMTMSGTASLEMGYGWNGNSSTPTYGAVVSGVQSGINMGFNDAHTGYIGKINITAPTTNTVKINGNEYTIITDATDLAGINTDVSTKYVLANDITSGMDTWLGREYYAAFNLNGLGHVISGLTSSGTNASGLFNYISGASLIENIGLDSVNISGSNEFSGTLGGIVNYGGIGTRIRNSFVSGVLNTNVNLTGGLVGYLHFGTIDNSFFKGNVSSTNDMIGGLVGRLGSNSRISYSFSEANVSSIKDSELAGIGGLAGWVEAGARITDSYSIGDVTGTLSADGTVSWIGGLVGQNDGRISNSYVKGTVSGGSMVMFGVANNNVSDSYYIADANTNNDNMWDNGLKVDEGIPNYSVTNEAALRTTMTEITSTPYEVKSGATLPSLKSKYASSTVTPPEPEVEPVEPTPVPNPEPTKSASTTQDTKIEKVITSIVNNTTTNVNLPKDVLVPKVNLGQNMPILPMTPTVQSSPMMQNIAQRLGVNQGEQLSLVSTTQEGQSTQRITLDELKNLSEGSNDSNAQTNTPLETRVAVGDNSIIELVNGGMALPEGVDQEFYVTKNKKNNK